MFLSRNHRLYAIICYSLQLNHEVTVLYPSLQKQLLLFENSPQKKIVSWNTKCASYSTPWFLPMKGQLLIDTCIPVSSLLPGGSDDVGRNVPKHCLLTWQRHPRSSVGVQGAYNTRHPLPKLQDRKTGASFVSVGQQQGMPKNDFLVKIKENRIVWMNFGDAGLEWGKIQFNKFQKSVNEKGTYPSISSIINPINPLRIFV